MVVRAVNLIAVPNGLPRHRACHLIPRRKKNDLTATRSCGVREVKASPALKFLPASCSLSGLSLCVLKLTPKPSLPPHPQDLLQYVTVTGNGGLSSSWPLCRSL